MSRLRNFNPATREAAVLLGKQIRAARIQQRFTQAELAERVGVSLVTVGKIEQGDLGVALGSVLEAATIVGIPLFADTDRRRQETRRVRDMLALLPDQVHEHTGPARNDF